MADSTGRVTRSLRAAAPPNDLAGPPAGTASFSSAVAATDAGRVQAFLVQRAGDDVAVDDFCRRLGKQAGKGKRRYALPAAALSDDGK